MIVSFSGHRPNKLGGWILPNPTYNHICKEIQRILLELNPTKVISGMALGIDQWAAFICVKNGIPFTAAIPFEGQESAWPLKSRATYKALLNKAADKVIVSPGSYSAQKMQIRNEYMVNNSDILIAVYNGDKVGGTANCVRYAESLNKKIIYIDPTP
jgi:uncharacterized phage-like protein YoqJ